MCRNLWMTSPLRNKYFVFILLDFVILFVFLYLSYLTWVLFKTSKIRFLHNRLFTNISRSWDTMFFRRYSTFLIRISLQTLNIIYYSSPVRGIYPYPILSPLPEILVMVHFLIRDNYQIFVKRKNWVRRRTEY